MTERKTGRLNWVIISGLLLSLIFSACNGTLPTGQTPAAATTESSLVETATDQPAATETSRPEKVMLMTAGMDEVTQNNLSTTLADLGSKNGLLYEEQADFQAAEIGADWQVVVLYASDATLPEALAATPETQFIVYSDRDLTPSSNINVIRLRRDKQAFLAGYLSTLITSDWRTAGLFAPDGSGDTEEQAFINGGQYFCGICNPYYAPLVRFPLSARISGNADPSVWQGEMDTLLGNIIYTVYVSPGAESPVLLDTLAQKDLILVGSGNPPDALRNRWAASVMLDVAAPLEEIWPDVLAGQGGVSLETPVMLANINEEFLTPGKQRLVDNVLEELDSGWIHPLDIPE